MVIFNNVYHVIMCIIFIWIGFSVLVLITDTCKWMESLAAYFNHKTEREVNPRICLKERIKTTNTLLDLVDEMIENEIKGTFKSYVKLGESYPANKMPEDIERISTTVYKSLTKDIFGNTELVINNEYINQYICEQTTLVLLVAYQNINDYINDNA